MAGMVPFDWADPFDLESQLTEEERMIRDAARGFAQGGLSQAPGQRQSRQWHSERG